MDTRDALQYIDLASAKRKAANYNAEARWREKAQRERESLAPVIDFCAALSGVEFTFYDAHPNLGGEVVAFNLRGGPRSARLEFRFGYRVEDGGRSLSVYVGSHRAACRFQGSEKGRGTVIYCHTFGSDAFVDEAEAIRRIAAAIAEHCEVRP